MAENQITANFVYLTSSNFVTISHINYWDQVNSWKNLWKFWNGLLCRNKSGPFLLLNVAAYWQNNNPEGCINKLSQILASNDNKGRGIGLRFYVRCCRLGLMDLWFCFNDLIKVFLHSVKVFVEHLFLIALAYLRRNHTSKEKASSESF